MTKESFVKLMEALKTQREYDLRISNLFSQNFECDFYYSNDALYDSIISTLEKELGDDFGWIAYYVYEMNFGNRLNEVSVNGAQVSLKSVDDLWSLISHD